jgi:hypothetical protein
MGNHIFGALEIIGNESKWPFAQFSLAARAADSPHLHLPKEKSNRCRGRLLAACRSESPIDPIGESDRNAVA